MENGPESRDAKGFVHSQTKTLVVLIKHMIERAASLPQVHSEKKIKEWTFTATFLMKDLSTHTRNLKTNFTESKQWKHYT